MSDLTRYIRARAERDSDFAEAFDTGYDDFRNDVVLRSASEATGPMPGDVAEKLADETRAAAEIKERTGEP